ncbi:MAG: PEP-CTERM sorting domain-containing protein [Burkholderiaceae bacterium]
MFKKAMAGLGLAAAASIASAASVELVTNGGFETNLAGWNNTLNVVQSGTTPAVPLVGWPSVSPAVGSGMAVMSPLGTVDSDLAQTLTVDTSLYSSYTVSFRYRLIGLDVTRTLELSDDFLRASIGSTTLISVPLNDVWSLQPSPADTGWQTFSQTFAGTNSGVQVASLAFHLSNVVGGDAGQSTVAYLDAVSIQATVPEPGVLALVGAGLVAAGMARRRRVRA